MPRKPKPWTDLVGVDDISVIDVVRYELYTWGAAKALHMMTDPEHNNSSSQQQQPTQAGAADSAAMDEEPEDGVCTYFEHVLAVEGFAGEGAAVEGLLGLQHAQPMSTDN